jgi:NADH-quinone oxidoreductase subunit M
MATLLLITVLLPIAGSLVLAASPRLDHRAARQIALLCTLGTLAFSLILLFAFRSGVLTPQFAYGPPEGPYGLGWLSRPDIRLALGLDGLSLWLFLLTAVLMITAVFSSWEPIRERAPLYYAFLLALETGLLGLFASLDVVLFYIFFEFTLIPLFFLIGLWGGPQRQRASIIFFLYTLAGSLLTLLGVIALVVVHYQYSRGNVLSFSIPELTHGLAVLPWPEWHDVSSWKSPQVLIFLLLLAGFAIKVPMFPFHTWLPLAHVEAPTAGSIILAGVLLKVGSYGLLRFNMSMTPLGAVSLFPLLATLAVIGIVYGALVALAQSDIKKLVAYSSVSHMGFVVLGLFALNSTGMDGSVIQMVNHGLTTGALFACVGILYERYHTREMDEVGGLWNRLPVLAFFFMLSALGSAALPGLNGFVGEFPILVGMFAESPRTAVLAATGMILGACYLLWMLRKVIFGPLHEPAVAGHGNEHGDAAGAEDAAAHPAGIAPVGWHEVAGLSPIMVLIVLIGVMPGPFFNRIRPSTQEIDKNIQAQRSVMKGLAPDQSVPAVALISDLPGAAAARVVASASVAGRSLMLPSAAGKAPFSTSLPAERAPEGIQK